MVIQLFFDNVFRLHRMTVSIVYHCDPALTSSFWKELFILQGITFNFSRAYHRQTDGQTEARLIEFCNNTWDASPMLAQLLGFNSCLRQNHVTTCPKSLPSRWVPPRGPLQNYNPPILLSYVPGIEKSSKVDLFLRSRDQLLLELHTNLAEAQNRMQIFIKGIWNWQREIMTTWHCGLTDRSLSWYEIHF